MSGKSLGILAILAAVLVGVAVYLSNRPPAAIEGAGQPVFPGMENEINDVSRITVKSSTETVTLVRNDNGWQVKQRHDYPASLGQIRRLLIGVAGLTRIEPKTRNPKLYSDIGLRDLKDKASKATLIELKGDGGRTMAAVLVGSRQPDRADPTSQEYFVRKPGDPQSWLVSGNLLLEAAPNRWLHPELLDIKSRRIQRVAVKRASGQEVTVYKHDAQATDFHLADMPKGAKVKSTFTINDIANTMGRLSVDDVFQSGQLKLRDKPSFVATLETFDGLRLTMKAYADASGKKPQYVRLFAAYDPALAPKEAKAQNHGKNAANKKAVKLKPAEDVKKEAHSLNKQFAPWIYKLPPFQVNNIDKQRSDLITDATPSGARKSKSKPPHIRKFSPR